VVIHETGDPGVLRQEEADRPSPGDGEVLIKVDAARTSRLRDRRAGNW
jgi:NADPH:quinone reductase-like Zn-dependent oxidoreductase